MRVLIVCAHPRGDSYTHAVTEAARHGSERAGHEVTVLDLYALGLAPAMSRDELAAYQAGTAPIDPVARDHAALVKSHDVLVFIYPTWWSGLPAILKGWLERVMVQGVAFRLDDGKISPALQHVRRIVGISTYGAPWSYVKLLQDGGRRTLTRALRMSCGRHTATTWIGFYSIDTAGDAERAAFLDRVEHTLAHLDRPTMPTRAGAA